MSLKVYVLKPRKDLEISVCVSANEAETFEKVLEGLIDCERIVDTLLEAAKKETGETPKKIIEAAELALKKARDGE